MAYPPPRLLLGSALLLLAGSVLLLHAAPSPAAARGATPPVRPSQTVSYEAGNARWLNAPRTVEMSQGVTFNQDDAYLKTAAAVVALDDQQRALNAKSGTAVHLYDTQNDLTGAQGFVDFTRHLATLTGNIVLVVKPAPNTSPASVRSQFKDAATLTCALMTYDYRQKIGRVPGALTIHQKDRVLTADTGEYDTRAQTVVLKGNVHGHNGDGEIHAPYVKMGLQEGKEYIFLPGPSIHGHFNVPPEQADLLPNAPDTADIPAPKSSVTAPIASPRPAVASPAPAPASPPTR